MPLSPVKQDEDDGASFTCRKGEWMGLAMNWSDTRRMLRLELAKGPRMLPPLNREIVVRFG